VLRHRFAGKRLSLAGALAYEPDGSDAHLVFQLRPGAYNDETPIDFLTDVHDIEQRRVLLIWDGMPSHRSQRMLQWVASQRDWLRIEPAIQAAIDYFYSGPVAAQAVAFSSANAFGDDSGAAHTGLLTDQDFAEFGRNGTLIEDPVRASYRGVEVLKCGP
jgi:hypothetical protein